MVTVVFILRLFVHVVASGVEARGTNAEAGAADANE